MREPYVRINRGTEYRERNLEKEIQENKQVSSTSLWNQVRKPEIRLGQQVARSGNEARKPETRLGQQMWGQEIRWGSWKSDWDSRYGIRKSGEETGNHIGTAGTGSWNQVRKPEIRLGQQVRDQELRWRSRCTRKAGMGDVWGWGEQLRQSTRGGAEWRGIELGG
jgi:hypothetical protein